MVVRIHDGNRLTGTVERQLVQAVGVPDLIGAVRRFPSRGGGLEEQVWLGHPACRRTSGQKGTRFQFLYNQKSSFRRDSCLENTKIGAAVRTWNSQHGRMASR